MLLIEFDPNFNARWAKADFAISTGPMTDAFSAGDVCAHWTAGACDKPAKGTASPLSLAERINPPLRAGVRAMIGNAGPEVTFRHIYGGNARLNVRHILKWTRDAYSLVGSRLVLAPMDYDLIHDVMTGGRLLDPATGTGTDAKGESKCAAAMTRSKAARGRKR